MNVSPFYSRCVRGEKTDKLACVNKALGRGCLRLRIRTPILQHVRAQ